MYGGSIPLDLTFISQSCEIGKNPPSFGTENITNDDSLVLDQLIQPLEESDAPMSGPE